MCKVSVVIPCYNSEQYIQKCFQSLSEQTFKDFNILLVDDCSTDNSVAIARKFADEYNLLLEIIQNEKNIGPSLSRKNGIVASKSEYIAFCDSDDWVEPDFLSTLIKESDEGKNDIVFCNFQTVYSNGNIVKHEVVSRITGNDKKAMVAMSFDSMCCMLIRRQLFLDIDFPNIRNGEDMAIIPVLVSRADTYGYTQSYIYNYNYHSGSLSKTFTNEMVASLKNSFAYIQKHLGSEYPNEVEFLGIRNLLYGGILNLFKGSFDTRLAKTIIDDFEKEYSNWENNKYYSSLPSYKKIYLFCVKKKIFIFCRFLSIIHKIISK